MNVDINRPNDFTQLVDESFDEKCSMKGLCSSVYDELGKYLSKEIHTTKPRDTELLKKFKEDPSATLVNFPYLFYIFLFTFKKYMSSKEGSFKGLKCRLPKILV